MCAKARVKAKARQQAKREYKRQGGRLSIHPPGWETAARSTPRLSTLHLSFPAPSNNLSLRLIPLSPLFRSRSQTLMGLPSLANKWALGATWRAKCVRLQRTFHSEQGISHSTSKIYGSRKMIELYLFCFVFCCCYYHFWFLNLSLNIGKRQQEEDKWCRLWEACNINTCTSEPLTQERTITGRLKGNVTW